jgi:transposase
LKAEQLNQIEKILQEQPDLRLEQIKERLSLPCHESTIDRAIRKLGYRYKKNFASGRARADIAQRRTAWKDKQSTLALDKLVFIDERGAKTNMTRLYGRTKEGKRCIDQAPAGSWSTTSLLGSLRLNGNNACLLIEGAANACVFREYVKHVLLPTLQPGDWVIADNLSIHKISKRDNISSPWEPTWFFCLPIRLI